LGRVNESERESPGRRPKMKIGVLMTRLRIEEKWLFEALEKRGMAY
jgi:hypothetical protein